VHEANAAEVPLTVLHQLDQRATGWAPAADRPQHTVSVDQVTHRRDFDRLDRLIADPLPRRLGPGREVAGVEVVPEQRAAYGAKGSEEDPFAAPVREPQACFGSVVGVGLLAVHDPPLSVRVRSLLRLREFPPFETALGHHAQGLSLDGVHTVDRLGPCGPQVPGPWSLWVR
jgi:hypothetical protein